MKLLINTFFYLTIFSASIFPLQSKATKNAEIKHSQHQHNLMGSHGMVLLYDPIEGFIASHLPLYSTPHNYQIIYKIRIDNPDKLIQLLKTESVTLLPDNFNLMRLVNGEKFIIKANFFRGHFERGGKQVLSTNMSFEQPILVDKLSKDYVSNNAIFHTILLNDSTSIVAHKIQKKPSFDAVGFMKKEVDDKANRIVCEKPPSIDIATIKHHLKDCASFTLHYIETKDFK